MLVGVFVLYMQQRSHTLFRLILFAVNINLESFKGVICNLNVVNIFARVYVFTSSCFICAISHKIPML